MSRQRGISHLLDPTDPWQKLLAVHTLATDLIPWPVLGRSCPRLAPLCLAHSPLVGLELHHRLCQQAGKSNSSQPEARNRRKPRKKKRRDEAEEEEEKKKRRSKEKKQRKTSSKQARSKQASKQEARSKQQAVKPGEGALSWLALLFKCLGCPSVSPTVSSFLSLVLVLPFLPNRRPLLRLL